MNAMTALRAAFIGVLLLIASLSAATAENARQLLRGALAANKPVVLVVARNPTAADLKSEAYGDYAEYLNAFSAAHRERFAFIKVKAAELKSLFAQSTPVRGPFATVLIRGADGAVYYDGKIQDPPTYQIAADFLTGGPEAATASAGFKPFRFKLRGGP
jgi:hypothetical protein